MEIANVDNKDFDLSDISVSGEGTVDNLTITMAMYMLMITITHLAMC